MWHSGLPTKRWSIRYHCSHSLLNLKEAAIWNLFHYLTSVTLLLNSDLQNNLTMLFSPFLCKSEKTARENKKYKVIHNVLLPALKHNIICSKRKKKKKALKYHLGKSEKGCCRISKKKIQRFFCPGVPRLLKCPFNGTFIWEKSSTVKCRVLLKMFSTFSTCQTLQTSGRCSKKNEENKNAVVFFFSCSLKLTSLLVNYSETIISTRNYSLIFPCD